MVALLAFLRSPLARYLGAALAVALLAGWAYLAVFNRGVADCERKHALALAAHIQRAQTQAAEIALQDAEISESYELWRTRVVTKVEEVIREIPADCTQCRLNPNGVSLINAARGGGLPMAQNPDQPDAAVPAPPATQNRNDAGTGRHSLDGRTPVLRLQNATELADPGREGKGV